MSVGTSNSTQITSNSNNSTVDKKEMLKKMKKLSMGPAMSPRYEYTMSRSVSRSFEKSRSMSISSVNESHHHAPVTTPTTTHTQAPLKRLSSLDVKPKGFLTSF